MAWLSETHPELVPLYTKTYRGAYAPKAVGETLTTTVRRVLSDVGGLDRAPARTEVQQQPELSRDHPVQQTLL